MKKLLSLFLILFSISARADLVTIGVTVTNAPVKSATNYITVLGATRYWDDSNTAAKILTNTTTTAHSATNLFLDFSRFAQRGVTVTMPETNLVVFRGLDLTLTQGGDWASITTTNAPGTNVTALMIPFANVPIAVRTNQAAEIFQALTNYVSAFTNGGGQTITLTGDVTGSGTGSFAATIPSGTVTLAKMANLAQDQFIGRTTASTGVPETATITAFARTFLDDTTAAQVRTTIGAGTGSGDALVANPLSQFAATSSAQLAGVISDETGTGALVLATNPTLAGATFSGAVDFGAQTIANFKSVINAQTGTTYTIQASDCGKVVTASNASAITVTFTTAFPDGGSASVLQLGAGQVTIAVTGLTIRNRQGYTKTGGQYAAITLIRIGTDLWLTGDGQ